MKELNPNKKYDLRKLTNEQLNILLNYFKKNYPSWEKITIEQLIEKPFIDFWDNRWCQYQGKNATCATELFEDEKGNVIPWIEESNVIDVDKYNEIKFRESYNIELNKHTMTEEEKELWLFVYKESVKYQQTFITHKQKADQAVKDFREALKM